MNMTFQPSGDKLVDVEGASVITFKGPNDNTMVRMKDYSPDMEIYGLLPQDRTAARHGETGHRRVPEDRRRLRVREAMMKIASLLLGTTEEVPSLETKPSAKKKK